MQPILVQVIGKGYEGGSEMEILPHGCCTHVLSVHDFERIL